MVDFNYQAPYHEATNPASHLVLHRYIRRMYDQGLIDPLGVYKPLV